MPRFAARGTRRKPKSVVSARCGVVAHVRPSIACPAPMPELPEVETVMRGLRERLEGRVIVRAIAHRPDLRWPLPEGLQSRLTGARVTGFRRRGKYILMRLAGGDSVLLHLGMSGRMVLTPAAAQPAHAARASGAGDRRRLAAGLRRSAPLRLGRSGADAAGGRPPAARRPGPRTAGSRLLARPPRPPR